MPQAELERLPGNETPVMACIWSNIWTPNLVYLGGLEVEAPWGHEQVGHLFSHLLSPRLVLGDHGRQHGDQLCLHLAGQQPARPVLLALPRQFLIILAEEAEVLVADVHLGVAALGPVLLHRVLPAGEGVLVNLVLDLLGREEGGMQEGRLQVTQPGGHVPGHPEVGVLVDGAGDQAGHSLLVPEDEGEGGGEAGGRLYSWEADLPYRTAVIKPEDSFR